MPVETRPTLVDLYCGIGIGSLGFLRQGFEIVSAVDIDPEASAIYRENLGASPIVGDLRKVSGLDILKDAGLKRGELSVCVGCPPCQGFSTLRKTRLKKGERDNRKSLLRVFAERVKELLPQIVVLENVRGLSFSGNRQYLQEFMAVIRGLGYSSYLRVMNAADYGAPQRRLRLVVIGKLGGPPGLPEPSHSDPRASHKQNRWATVRDAIADLPQLDAGETNPADPLHASSAHSESVLQLIRNIPLDGGGRKSLPEEMWLPCHRRLRQKNKRGAESIYGRMRWDSPSPTITTRSHIPSCGRFVHPTQDRGITLREAARLQSIPDDYKISGSKDKAGRWIGNAMPLALAETIAQHILTNELNSTNT